MNKILSSSILLKIKKKKKKIVLCHGVFDIVHAGHIKYFDEAKKHGDLLIVSITDDQFVNKGPGRPVFKINERVSVLSNLKQIDYIYISNNFTSENIIKIIKPNFYCKGLDYKSAKLNDKNLQKEIKQLKKNNGKFVIINQPLQSSSKAINQSNLLFNTETNNFLNNIRKKYTLESINKKLKVIQKLSVMIMGEIIIDKYIYTEAIGKSGKDSFLVLEKKKEDTFLGGTGYMANVLSSFVKNPTLLSFLGTDKKEIAFVKKNIKKNVKFKYFIKKNSTNFTKTRFVDLYSKNKVLGVYNLNDQFISKSEENIFINTLKTNINKFDLIILSDYGHGIFTDKIRNMIQRYKDKIFLNTQINSFNRGYHTLFKYNKVNTLVINESELRYELRNKVSKVEDLVKKIKQKITLENIIITRGKFGVQFYRGNKKYECPAFSENALDAIGAGDTFLTLISICLKAKIDTNIAMLIASLGASYATQKIGHSEILNSEYINKSLIYLLK